MSATPAPAIAQPWTVAWHADSTTTIQGGPPPSGRIPTDVLSGIITARAMGSRVANVETEGRTFRAERQPIEPAEAGVVTAVWRVTETTGGPTRCQHLDRHSTPDGSWECVACLADVTASSFEDEVARVAELWSEADAAPAGSAEKAARVEMALHWSLLAGKTARNVRGRTGTLRGLPAAIKDEGGIQ